MTKEELKQYIDENVYENPDGDITGESLNEVLKAIVDDAGTEVEANPTGTPTETMQTIKIGEKIYTAPEGPEGPTGPANALTIGTVQEGEQAAANITGDAPNQMLNLTLPKGEQGAPGQNAVNPFKGWFTTDNIPTTGQEGDYCNVSDTSVTPHTVTIYRWNTTINQFEDTGEVPDTATGETFASSETLQEVAIDDSHLVNPVNTADAMQPVLAKAADVMQLKAKLEGVTVSETKIGYVDGSLLTGHYVGEGGSTSGTSTSYDCATFDVAGYEKVRFLGVETSTSQYSRGYAFYDSEGVYIVNSYKKYDVASDGTAKAKEYVISVPQNAKYFKTNVRIGSYLTLTTFYCYLLKGETVLDEIRNNKVSEYIDNNEKLYCLIDSNNKELLSIYKNGIMKVNVDLELHGEKTLIDKNYIIEQQSSDYLYALIDNNMRFIAGVKNDGSFIWSKGIPQHLIEYIDENGNGSSEIYSGNFVKTTIENLVLRTPNLIMEYKDGGYHDKPVLTGQKNALKLADAFANINWECHSNVGGCFSSSGLRKTFSGSVTGVPYSAVGERQVGFYVSLETFLTAANNPYSLLYTEDTYKESSKSAWGFTYTGGKSGGTYYGTVCSHFVDYATGSRFYNGSINQISWCRDVSLTKAQVCSTPKRILEGIGETIDITNIDDARIGDIIAYVNENKGSGHCRLITDIERDDNGHILNIQITEAMPNYSASNVRQASFTRQQIVDYLLGKGDDGDSESGGRGYILRNSYLNIFNDLSEIPGDDYEYNNDVCTFAGDKCVFKTNSLIVINYNLTNSLSFGYVGLRCYKIERGYNRATQTTSYNETLLVEREFSDIDQGVLPEEEKNHAWKLSEESDFSYEEGFYRVCAYDENDNESDSTQFCIVNGQIDVNQVNNGDIEVTFNFNSAVNDVLRINGLINDSTVFFYDVTPNDFEDRRCVIPFKALNDIQYNSSIKNGENNIQLNFVVKTMFGSTILRFYDNIINLDK